MRENCEITWKIYLTKKEGKRKERCVHLQSNDMHLHYFMTIFRLQETQKKYRTEKKYDTFVTAYYC